MVVVIVIVMVIVIVIVSNCHGQNGFSIIELLVALGIFVVCATSIMMLITSSLDWVTVSKHRLKAQELAKEGMEAARSIRNEDWSNLEDGSHGLAISGGRWVFSGTQEVIEQKFTRTITVTTVASDRKQVTSKVSWQSSDGSKQKVELTGELTNWQKLYQPPETGFADVGDEARDVYVKGDYTYLAVWDQHQGLAIVDTSSPLSPSLVTNLDLGGKGQDVFVQGNYAYVALDTNKVAVVDISNPSSPSHVASMWISARPTSVFVKDGYAYIGQDKRNEGLVLFSVADPESPYYIRSYNIGTEVNDVEVAGGWIWMAVNLGMGLDIEGDYAYVAVALEDTGLEIYYIAAAPNYWSISSVDVGGEGSNVDVLQNTGFTAVQTEDQGSAEVDVADLYNPQFVEGTDIGGRANGVFTTANYVYFATTNEDEGLAVIAR